MKLYLVRHGEALTEESDPRLSPEGREAVEKVAEYLAGRKITVDRIECSMKRRALETAETIARAVGASHKVVQREGLKPNDDIAVIMEDLRGSKGDRMLVGHMPYMAKLAAALLAGSWPGQQVEFRTATAVCLTGDGKSGWELEWKIDPDEA